MMENRNKDILDYYGITREEVEGEFLTGSRENMLKQSIGMIVEAKRQIQANNNRLAGLNLEIAELIQKYLLDDMGREEDWRMK